MDDHETQTLTIEEAARVLGISRSLAYETARTGHLAGVPVIRIGNRRLISRRALDRVLCGDQPAREIPERCDQV